MDDVIAKFNADCVEYMESHGGMYTIRIQKIPVTGEPSLYIGSDIPYLEVAVSDDARWIKCICDARQFKAK